MAETWTPEIREVGPPADLQPLALRVRGLAWSGTLDTGAEKAGGEHSRRLLVTVHDSDVIGDFQAMFWDAAVKGTITVELPNGGTSTTSGVITARYGTAGVDESACSDPECCTADYERSWELTVDGQDQRALWEHWNGGKVTVMLQGYALTRHDVDHPRFDPDVEAKLSAHWRGHKPGEWVRMPASEADRLARGGRIVRKYAEGESLAEKAAALEAARREADLPTYLGWLEATIGQFMRLRERVEHAPYEWRSGEGPTQLEEVHLQALLGSLQGPGDWLNQMWAAGNAVSPAARSVSDTVRRQTEGIRS